MDLEVQVADRVQDIKMMTKWVVAYAKITLDKDNGVNLLNVYFGGIGDTAEEAAKIASECVNNNRGGTIIPKIFPVDESVGLVDVMYEAADRFESTVNRMKEAEAIINRGKKK